MTEDDPDLKARLEERLRSSETRGAKGVIRGSDRLRQIAEPYLSDTLLNQYIDVEEFLQSKTEFLQRGNRVVQDAMRGAAEEIAGEPLSPDLGRRSRQEQQQQEGQRPPSTPPPTRPPIRFPRR